MNAADVLFWIFALGAAGGAVAVTVTQNVVRMAFLLVVALGSAAGLFFLMSADFVAATQLLIYVGGTVVLLVFGVMLTATGPYVQIKTSPAELFLSAGIGVLFLAMIVSTVAAVDWDQAPSVQAMETAHAEMYNPPGVGNTTRPLGMSFLGLRPDRDLGRPSGKLSTGYLLPFEIVSIHLLVVLVGAGYLARAKRRVESAETR